MLLKSVTIIGSGNVATQLGTALLAHGIPVDAVYSRDLNRAASLATRLQSKPLNDIGKIPLDSGIYLIAVSDNAITEIAGQLPQVQGMVVHTAGMVPLSVLDKHARSGVFYPLQSLTGSVQIDFANVPFLVEAKQDEDVQLLRRMGETIGSPVYEVASDQRQFYHLAAVFANNFTNHLYHIASTILSKENLSFDILKPVILETARKASEHAPFDSQTGPAKRNDIATMEQHIRLLSHYPQYKQLYEMLSDSIRKEYAPGDKNKNNV